MGKIMTKKILYTLLIGFLLLGISTQSALANDKSSQLSINDTQIETTGPLSYIIHVSNVEFIQGPILKIWLMSYILTSTNMHFFLPYIKINVKDLTFLVTYTKNTFNLPLLKRLEYNTSITINGNMTTYTEKHTVIVTEFSGIFYFSRVKPLRLTPAIFGFSGTCNQAVII